MVEDVIIFDLIREDFVDADYRADFDNPIHRALTRLGYKKVWVGGFSVDIGETDYTIKRGKKADNMIANIERVKNGEPIKKITVKLVKFC